MLWGIRIAFFVLVLLFVLSVTTSCTRWRVVDDAAIEAHRTEVLAAQTRRAQVVGEIARLAWVLRHTGNVERRIALELVLAERRAELDRLNAVILP